MVFLEQKISGSSPLSFTTILTMNKIHSTSHSQYVPHNIFRNALVQLNNIKFFSPLNLPRMNTNYLFAFLDSHVIHYPTPITLTYAWSFGSLAGICLVIQMISGIFLAMVRRMIRF